MTTTRDEYLDCGCVPPGSLNEPGQHFCGKYTLPTSVPWHEFTEDIHDASMCICGVPDLGHDDVYPPRPHCADCYRPLPHTAPEQRACATVRAVSGDLS